MFFSRFGKFIKSGEYKMSINGKMLGLARLAKLGKTNFDELYDHI